MGRIIQQNNGKTTVYTTGENINNIPVSANTYYVGVDTDGYYKLLKPSGSIDDFATGGSFTGGTVSGATNFTNGLSANTFSATTYLNLPIVGSTEVTYSEFVDKITGGTLSTGSYYIITDFQTCYDVPEYYVNGNAKGLAVIDYRQGNNESIVVLATNTDSISSTAYQPAYPNDRIQYDWTFNTTLSTGGVAYGRITERIDEYNNRTDYDHRNIYFNRFMSYNKGSELTGTINSYDSATGVITGNGTLFLSELQIGDILFFEYQGNMIGVRVTSGSTETLIHVVVDSSFGSQISFTGGLIPFYSATSTGNYNEYKEVYVGQKISEDWNDYLTFNLNGTTLSNYVGDYSKFYLQEVGSTSGFLLANNVFYGNNIYSNTIGDRSYNNTAKYWFTRNTIAGRFYNNSIHQNGFYSNSIGEYFYNNIIKSYMYVNTISEGFNNNTIGNQFNGNFIGEFFENNQTYSDFYTNTIGNSFAQNTIYSEFYENTIGIYYSDNIIGDLGNLTEFGFYRNKIGNNFNNNEVRQDFQNNQVGNQFNNNTVNGSFYKNVIGNGFNNNDNIGYDFYGNHIGNAFNGNLIGDYFSDNKIGEYFEDNNVSYNFRNNQINNNFYNNTFGDTQYFNWDNTTIQNLTGRTYNTFYNSLDESIGNVILGKELLMHFSRNSGTTLTSGYLVVGETYGITNVAFGGGDFTNIADVIDGVINEVGCVFIATGTQPSSWCGITITELTVYNEYHKVKFNQWTQNSNGGGFSYERTKVYPSNESTVYFTKTNYGSEVDIIIPERLEIRRGDNQGLFNIAVEGGWNNSVSPGGTEWNSVYTSNNSGDDFQDNTINNEFKGNLIYQEFSLNKVASYVGANQFSGYTRANDIGTFTFANDFSGQVFGNKWYGDFYENNIGNEFLGNQFLGEVFYNNIGINFQGNQLGHYFNNNTIGDNFGYGNLESQGNKIGNNFYSNIIGEYFYNNNIADNFQNNIISDYFQWNVINTNINHINFTNNLGNITGFTYSTTGSTATNGLYVGVNSSTNGSGVNANFSINVSGDVVIGVSGLTVGSLYQNGDIITILGSEIGGNVPSDNITITVTGISEIPMVYEHYTKQIFENRNGEKRISFYDENDVLTLESILSGYITVYSQPLAFTINNTSVNFECDGFSVGNYSYGSQSVNNMSDLVFLFNTWLETNKNGFYFDNGDGRLGLYMSEAFKNNLCPTGVITMNVFND